ncbi:YciI family protein [Pacificibacter marinus]|uniref:YciI family protein n=1 Tax=Pacificibacter marinus TaxID=658057 RepID=UPI0020915A89|nr:YciI family protein [Pacificibacter marinus]
MQYMLLIYNAETNGPQPGTEEFGPYMQGYIDFTAEVREAGKLIGGEALESVASATTVSVRGGKTELVDGPFAETKEQLGGYYILDCVDLDEALKYAAKIPDAAYGRVEVRPVMIFD